MCVLCIECPFEEDQVQKLIQYFTAKDTFIGQRYWMWTSIDPRIDRVYIITRFKFILLHSFNIYWEGEKIKSPTAAKVILLKIVYVGKIRNV